MAAKTRQENVKNARQKLTQMCQRNRENKHELIDLQEEIN